MENLSNTGRIFYGIAITIIGVQAIYFLNLPYILPLPEHFAANSTTILSLIVGLIFTLAGISIIFNIWARPVSLLFGFMLLLIFCFYYIPYEIITDPNYLHLENWENAEKELAFAGGALVIAGSLLADDETRLTQILAKLIPPGAILFAITIVSFGILHFMYGAAVAGMVPAWIPWHLFWIYFAGAALIGSGVGIIFKFKTRLLATLLGIMIFLWFVLLHIPRVTVAAPADMPGEITSAFLALAYSGIAFVIAGANKK